MSNSFLTGLVANLMPSVTEDILLPLVRAALVEGQQFAAKTSNKVDDAVLGALVTALDRIIESKRGG